MAALCIRAGVLGRRITRPQRPAADETAGMPEERSTYLGWPYNKSKQHEGAIGQVHEDQAVNLATCLRLLQVLFLLVALLPAEGREVLVLPPRR